MSKNVRNDLALTVSSLTINNVTINTPNNASYTLTLPSNTGTNGQVLTTDGSGVLSWTTVSGGGGGTVTSVAATVPAFLSAAVVNPSTTPSVNITLSGTALPVLNGGTGVTTSTGTGSVVLSTNPTITSASSSTPLNITTASAITANMLDIFNPGVFSGSDLQIRLGKSTTECAVIRYNHNTTSTLSNFFLFLNSAVLKISGSNSIASTLSTPLTISGAVIAPSLTLSTTPLGTSSGGTGLSTVGTSGQYLSSNGTTLTWVNPSAGTGSVTSVSLAVDSSLTGLFTNTGSGTIVDTGTFTLTRVTNPSIGGNWTFSGNVAISGTTTLSSAVTAPSLSVTGQLTSTVATGTAPLVVSSTTNVPNLNASSLNGATFAAPGAIGSGSPSTGLFTSIGLTTPLSVANGGTGSVVSTGSGAVVLATSPTLVTPVIGAATGTSLSVTGQLTSTVATGTAPLVVSSTTNVPNLNASSLNGATFAAPGAIGGGTASTGAFTTLTLTNALSTSNGGTGLNSVGSNGQVLTISGGVPAWITPSTPGTGTVTSVGLTVDSSLSGLFTQTGSLSPISGSGTYTLSQASSPTIALTGSNFLLVSNSNTTSQAPLLVLQPNMGTSTTNTVWIGKATLFNGSAGIIQYSRISSDTDADNSLALGIGTGSYLTLKNGNGATISGGNFDVTNGTGNIRNTANDLSVILSASNDPLIADIEASQTSDFMQKRTLALNRFGGAVTIGGGGLSIATPLSTGSGGTGVTGSSTGTSGVVLKVSPTITTPILTGLTSLETAYFPTTQSGDAKISLYGAPPNSFQYDGFGTFPNTLKYQVAATTSDHAFYAGINSSSERELLRIKGSYGLEIQPLTSTSVRKLVLFDNEITANDFQYYGLGVGAGVLKYQINSTVGFHIFYAGTSNSTEKELLRIDGNGNVTTASTGSITFGIGNSPFTYQRGTWTPLSTTLKNTAGSSPPLGIAQWGNSYNITGTGYYVKLGSQVTLFFSCSTRFDGDGPDGPNGAINVFRIPVITGLPFKCLLSSTSIDIKMTGLTESVSFPNGYAGSLPGPLAVTMDSGFMPTIYEEGFVVNPTVPPAYIQDRSWTSDGRTLIISCNQSQWGVLGTTIWSNLKGVAYNANVLNTGTGYESAFTGQITYFTDE